MENALQKTLCHWNLEAKDSCGLFSRLNGWRSASAFAGAPMGGENWPYVNEKCNFVKGTACQHLCSYGHPLIDPQKLA